MYFAAIAQQVERILGKDEVPSSNLGSSSKNTRFSGVFLTFRGFFGGFFDRVFSLGTLGNTAFFYAHFFAAEIAVFLSLRSSERLFLYRRIRLFGNGGNAFSCGGPIFGNTYLHYVTEL